MKILKLLTLMLATLLAACASEPPPLTKDEMLQKLAAAGWEVLPQEKTLLYPAQLQKFTREPLASFTLRLNDAQGNSELITPLDFGKASVALKQETRKVNGFAHKNWFFAGIISNELRDRVKAALP